MSGNNGYYKDHKEKVNKVKYADRCRARASTYEYRIELRNKEAKRISELNKLDKIIYYIVVKKNVTSILPIKTFLKINYPELQVTDAAINYYIEKNKALRSELNKDAVENTDIIHEER